MMGEILVKFVHMSGFIKSQNIFAVACAFADFRALYTVPSALLLDTFSGVS